MEDKENNIFITGGAGYVGSMLAEKMVQRSDVSRVILLDKAGRPDSLPENVVYIQENTIGSWQEKVEKLSPTVVIHTAWEIREPYFADDKDKYQEQNVEGSKSVFQFAFDTESVQTLIHFSTVASYGARAENQVNYKFKESDLLRKSEYSYAEQKRLVEVILQKKYQDSDEESCPNVTVLRPASITGPKGRVIESGFGLQSALSGRLEDNTSIWHKLITSLLFFTPVTKSWVRQFVHEDDVVNIVETAMENNSDTYSVFNMAPPGKIMRGKDMAEAVGKIPINIHPQLIRVVFFIAWHVSFGVIPTAPGVWKTYSYPIAVDGSKVTKELGYEYKFECRDAFSTLSGRYADEARRMLGE